MGTSFYSDDELQKIGFNRVGKNVKLSRYARIYGAENISIDDNSRIDDFCILSGKIEIGKHVHIAVFCGLFGGDEGIILKDFAGLSSRSVIYAASDDYTGQAMTNPTMPDEFRKVTGGTVVIGKHALIGTGCTILSNISIGEGASVGAMSLINKELDPWTMYAGIPAKKIRNREKNILKLERKYKKEE